MAGPRRVGQTNRRARRRACPRRSYRPARTGRGPRCDSHRSGAGRATRRDDERASHRVGPQRRTAIAGRRRRRRERPMPPPCPPPQARKGITPLKQPRLSVAGVGQHPAAGNRRVAPPVAANAHTGSNRRVVASGHVDHPLTAVIGAGPYGLGVAAHLRARRVPTVVFGKPMEFWQRMPEALYLKSSWGGRSLWDRGGRSPVGRYVQPFEPHPGEPIPLAFFLRYARWFIEKTGPEIDPTYVESLDRGDAGFRLHPADGRG